MSATKNELSNQTWPQVLPVLPIRNGVFFPGMTLRLNVGRPRSMALIEDVKQKEGALVAVVATKSPDIEDPSPGDLYDVGTIARVLQVSKAGPVYAVTLQGLGRFRMLKVAQETPYLAASVEYAVESGDKKGVQAQALAVNLKKAVLELFEMLPGVPRTARENVEGITEPGALADHIVANADFELADKQKVLATFDVNDRIQLVLELVTRRREVIEVTSKIDTAVKDEMSKSQREYYLRQQLKAIREELGDDDGEEDLDELEERLKKAKLPPDVEKVANKELARLKTIPAQSGEYSVARTYLEWLADLPWSKTTTDNLNINNARQVLDADHHGLEKVKKRILEYLAVRGLKNDMKGPILCLSGPPGVGKTSLGQSIARAMGRKFVRMALGGVRDEAEVRGHRRTYVGALPGRLIQTMKRAGTSNPVVLLDEIDKLGRDFRGDPAAALLEVLDPEQNNTFSDHYLDVPFDLSKVLFIATANELDTIPAPLRDRMEIIELPGYTIDEKIDIAKKHLAPKQLRAHGLDDGALSLTDAALGKVVTAYTREAGVRNLERKLAEVCRNVAVKVATGEVKAGTPFVVDAPQVPDYLGPERFYDEVAERTELPGIATGLAWTPVGGDVLFIETTRMDGSGKVILTGQLGDVMKESAQAALSFLRSRAEALGIDPKFLEKSDLHIHFPAGAVPKDGPSAGVTILTALVSLLTGIKVRPDVAMTGEITLRGLVLPVGGIKEKMLAAHRLGVKRVILPMRNKKDIQEVPETARKELEFIPATEMDEVLVAALEKNPFKAGSMAMPPPPSGVTAPPAASP